MITCPAPISSKVRELEDLHGLWYLPSLLSASEVGEASDSPPTLII